MKPALFFLFLLLAAVAGGCQDSSVNDSGNAPSVTNPGLSDNVVRNLLLLHGIVRAGGASPSIEINGNVTCATVGVPPDPQPPAPQSAVRVTLTLDASLRPVGSQEPRWRTWRLNVVSTDLLPLWETADRVMVLENSYSIEEPGWAHGSALNIRFHVTRSSVSVAGMSLEQQQDHQTGDVQ